MIVSLPSIPAQPCHTAEDAGRALHARLLASAHLGVAGVLRSADPALQLAATVLGDDADDVTFVDLVDTLDAAA